MNGMEIIQAEEIVEVSAAEEQSLEEATYDAGAYVESNGNYEQAEEVETAFTEVIDSIVEPVEQVEAAPRETGQAGTTEQVPEQKSTLTKEIDPVTGETKTSGGSSSSESSTEEEPLEASADLSETQAPNEVSEKVVDELNQGEDGEAGVASDAANAKRDGEEYHDTMTVTGDDESGDQIHVGEKPAGLVEDEGVNVGGIAQPQIERHLPEQKIKAAGMGKHGLITEGTQGKQKHGTEGYPGMGKGTSGGGLPVGPGAGSVGDPGAGSVGEGGKKSYRGSYKGTGETVGTYFSGEGQSGQSCASVASEQADRSEISDSGSVTVNCGDGITITVTWKDGKKEVSIHGNLIDGDTPMPYTGSTYGGTPTDLSHKPPAGPDECGFLRMVAGGKMDAKSYYGYGSSGTTTFSPDGGGDEDDSGHFFGGLSGGDRVSPSPDPDDWDYYTPNVLAEALAKAQTE